MESCLQHAVELRPFQREALAALAGPGHVLCIAPTGAGKSLVYERAAHGRRTLLVTPLVALARQQHARLGGLAARGGAPAALGAGPGACGPPLASKSGIWIVSPERLRAPGTRERLRGWRPDFLVFDECHCLWDWGEEFRPAFREIPAVLRELRIERSLWLTATLPPAARLELRQAVAPARLVELGAFDLPPRLELRVARVPWVARAGALLGWLASQRDAGIVFAPTRDSARRLGRLIEATGRRALVYHAGLGSEERRAVEARLREAGGNEVVVATSAFGLGMDYPLLRWVALWQSPPSLLSLAQSIGRAARDPARAARALVLWEPEDFRLLEWSLRGSEKRKHELALVERFLAGPGCRRVTLKAYFGALPPPAAPEERCGVCDFCCVAGDLRGVRVGSADGAG